MEIANAVSDPSKIDTDLYSRQIGTFGFEMMGKIQRLKVLIIGMKGAGAEIAKNLTLMGVESICVVDNDIVCRRHLGSNFFLRPADVGNKTVSEACLPSLRDLNVNVLISSHNAPVSEDMLVKYDVVVLCDQDYESIISINKLCRENSLGKRIGFICADTFGMIGTTFVDMGPNFICFDQRGGELRTALVSGITLEEKGTVYLHSDDSMPFQTGDYVRFIEVEGMTELNDIEPVQIVVKDRHSFLIGDTRSYSPYISGGTVIEVRKPKKIDFRSFDECILDPSKSGFMMAMDHSIPDRANQLHWITMAYRMSNQRDTKKVMNRAKELNMRAKSCKVEEIDEKVLDNFIKYAQFKISPLCSFIGGAVAHEVIKYTGKYHPIEQWLYCDFTLPAELIGGADKEIKGFDERYKDQIAIWGSDIQFKIQNSKIFVVGAGALGCEFIKHFALFGCGSQKDGMITVTDDDRIEVSNMSRQFLFRARHVGLPKSKVSGDSAREINREIKLQSIELRVGSETEDYFNERFWSNLTIVVNALDNVKSRQYVDGRCVWYEKPLLESGTLGTMGNVQVIIPHVTQCYSESQDLPETSIPLCTLKHFPYRVEHTIEWSRDLFEGLFSQIPLDFNNIMNRSVDELGDIPEDRLKLLLRILCLNPESIKRELLVISLELIHKYYICDIQQLLYSFPENHMTSDGQKFWTSPKRIPSPIELDLHEKFIRLFIISFCKICASMMNKTIDISERDIESIGPIKFEEFKPKLLKLSQDNMNVEIDRPIYAEKVNAQLIERIREFSSVTLSSICMEKDDDTNFHVDFIWSSSVLRCRNYAIEECDRMKAKLISGKIIPAIATTTAMVGGLVALEFVKAICYKQLKIENFRNSFACLAMPVWLQSEPLPPNPTKDKDYDPVVQGPVRALPPNFTVWNKLLVFIPNGTVKQLIDWIRSKFNIHVIILSVGNTCIYNSFVPSHQAKRLTQKIVSLVETLTKKSIDPLCSHLAIEASCSDDNDIDVVIPTIKFEFRQ